LPAEKVHDNAPGPCKRIPADLNDAVPHHSTFSENRLNRFRESDILRHIFERVVIAAMVMGLVKGEGFAVDASVIRGECEPLSRQGDR
jgi:transposase